MHARALDLIEQEHDLLEAIDQDQFVLRYQPVVELASGRMVGAGGAGSLAAPHPRSARPSEFIPLAETSGLIVELGRSILERACRQATRWRGGTPS